MTDDWLDKRLKEHAEEMKALREAGDPYVDCKHEWVDADPEDTFSGHCAKCDISFARFAFCYCP